MSWNGNGFDLPVIRYRAMLHGVTKDDALMIGDSLTSDMRGGHRYGIDTCWYNPKGKPVADQRPHHEIRHLDEIVPLVTGG